MKIVIPGGSGQVGQVLARAFAADGDDVVVLSRHPGERPWPMVKWDGQSQGPWVRELDGADVVINLAGRSVNCRYTKSNRALIMNSRIESTRAIGQAIQSLDNPPRLWLQASTATIYAHRYDAPNDEAAGIIGGNEPNAPDTWRFSIEVAKAWEEMAQSFELPATRQVLMRLAILMAPDRGGVFDLLLGLVRRGLGGTNGDGRQFVSWIHDRDYIRAVRWLIEHEAIAGPINLAAPNPLPNAEFMRALRNAWGARFGLPASEWMLKVGTFAMRSETELVLKSRRVVPGRLLENGFEFEHPTWQEAARDLCARWRTNRKSR